MTTRILALTSFLLLCSCLSLVSAEDDTFTTTHFSGSGNCSTCHDGLVDTSGHDVSIVSDWGATMMANSAKDPFWRAKVAVELESNPHLATVINDKCASCHAPMAHYETVRVQNSEITILGQQGITDASHVLHDAAMNGVSCTLCHQVADDAGDLGTLDGFSGQYEINDVKALYGQYSNLTGQNMFQFTGYTPTFSEHISDSSLCAVCHNLKTPFVDANGVLLSTTPESEFPEQMPYTEWEHSIFDDDGSNPKSCQDCHMPSTTAKLSTRPTTLEPKEGFARHHFAGANTVMLTLLKDNAVTLDVTSADLAKGIERARDTLRSAVEMTLLSTERTDDELIVSLRLENNSGHKTPTSFPSRRMWLHVSVTDGSDQVVFESGRPNPDGSINGADNDTDQAAVEPHYEVITAPDQVQIYEPVMRNSDHAVTYTLLRAAGYLKDNRLTPKGFDKQVVPSDVAVRGQAFDDPDFNLGRDDITYRIPVEGDSDVEVDVVLYFQPLAYGFVQDLYASSHLAEVGEFRALYEDQALKYEEIAALHTTVSGVAGAEPIEDPGEVVPEEDSSVNDPSESDGEDEGSVTETNEENASADSSGASSSGGGSVDFLFLVVLGVLVMGRYHRDTRCTRQFI